MIPIQPSQVIAEPLVILTSPRLEKPLVGLAVSFESSHPDVHVKILLDSGLGLRGTIARLQNAGLYGVESGVVHIVAPADEELLDRLEYRYYVLPDTRRPFATTRLVFVTPADGDTPIKSFEELHKDTTVRIVVADPEVSELGHRTKSALDQLRWSDAGIDEVIIAHDWQGVLDRIIHRKADVGILFQHQAVTAGSSLKIISPLPEDIAPPVVYAMEMDRFCPNRELCQSFLDFTKSPEARAILAGLGYGAPGSSRKDGVTSETRGTEGKETVALATDSPWWVRFLNLFRSEGELKTSSVE
ncbi:molybdate ABC transporter substrate-binding protein [Petrachloros mirabilis]